MKMNRSLVASMMAIVGVLVAINAQASKVSPNGQVNAYGKEASCENTYGKNTFVDCRDGKTYKTVTVDNQVWMAENLNFATLDGQGSWCYEGESKNCERFGRLYSWSTSMDLSSSYLEEKWNVAKEGYKGICPIGWHIPSEREWAKFSQSTAEKFSLGGGNAYKEIGSALKTKQDWKKGLKGSDIVGFSALPAGNRSEKGTFSGMGSQAAWWGIKEHNHSQAYYNHFVKGGEKFGATHGSKSDAKSLRCIKN